MKYLLPYLEAVMKPPINDSRTAKGFILVDNELKFSVLSANSSRAFTKLALFTVSYI